MVCLYRQRSLEVGLEEFVPVCVKFRDAYATFSFQMRAAKFLIGVQ